ncbi:hypothetical protein [Bacillus sp. SJS]|uniref:hypothetical protein n=1 Tax=Bacillus sp. SJS TaxID=1423321 RepID=UPI0004DD771F|nr:hypothetical protein [Bacillus sp. SJS]KZZ85634.1 hypothetical protein AS29_003335 [Bacillus sp. SJS]
MKLIDESLVSSIIMDYGEQVKVNDKETEAIITNPLISEQEERYIHTVQNVPRGSVVDYKTFKYLTITESSSMRTAKYKALMRQCNHVIEFPGEITNGKFLGYDDLGRAVFEEIVGEPTYVHAIVDNKSFSVNSTDAIRVPVNEIILVLQDNKVNKEKIKINFKFPSMDKKWTVQNIDLTQSGLMICNCKTV